MLEDCNNKPVRTIQRKKQNLVTNMKANAQAAINSKAPTKPLALNTLLHILLL